MFDPGWMDRLLDHATLALLIVIAAVVAFCADEASSLRGRLWSVRHAWEWAARDATTVANTRAGTTVSTTSTRQTALRLLRDVIGDL